MKFHEYADVLYVNLNVELQKEFSLQKQAYSRAIPDLINWQRSGFKLVAYFSIVFGYLKAKLSGNYPIRLPLPGQDAQKEAGQAQAQP